MKKIYRIEIWASEDSCEESWYAHELSDFFLDKEKAEAELAKYDGLTRRELEDKFDTFVSVRDNKPYIAEYELVE